MKIQVVRCDGKIETLNLAGQIQANDPAPDGQGSLSVKETGMEHFFRAEDGAYDGWAMDVHDLNLKGVDVIGFIEEVDKGRQIQEPRRPK